MDGSRITVALSVTALTLLGVAVLVYFAADNKALTIFVASGAILLAGVAIVQAIRTRTRPGGS